MISIGIARPKADPAPHGELIWSEQFSGTAGSKPPSTRWRLIEGGGGFGNAELQYYTARSENVQERNGDLVLTALRGPYRGPDGVERQYTSAALETKGLFATRYGRIEARIDVPAGSGLWPAFWAEGQDIDRVGWPAAGEIDVMETHGSAPRAVTGSVHGPAAGEPHGYAVHAPYLAPRRLTGGFHVYGIEWAPDKITFTLDGHPYGTVTPTSLGSAGRWVFDRPEFLILDLAVGGTDTSPPTAATRFPAHMYVDWVRVYR